MISRRLVVMTSILVGALMCAAVVQAQRPGGGRFGGGNRFGGVRGGGGTDIFNTMVRLLSVEKVQKEIDLLPEQLADVQKALEAQRGRRFGGGAGGERPNFREMTEQQREEFFANMRKEAEKRQKELKEKISEYLLPHQMDRLQEIALQLTGVAALMDDEIAKKLGISEAQKEKMEAVQQEAREQMFARFRGGQDGGERPNFREMSEEERQKFFDNIRKEAEERQKELSNKLVGALTASQKSEWEKMQGKPFELSEEERGQLRGFGGGAPGGGRFGGGRPGGQGGFGGRPGGGRPGGGRPGGGRPAPDDSP